MKLKFGAFNEDYVGRNDPLLPHDNSHINLREKNIKIFWKTFFYYMGSSELKYKIQKEKNFA